MVTRISVFNQRSNKGLFWQK